MLINFYAQRKSDRLKQSTDTWLCYKIELQICQPKILV